jgi:hypothetical protein
MAMVKTRSRSLAEIESYVNIEAIGPDATSVNLDSEKLSHNVA